MSKKHYNGKPMTFVESLHFCGCGVCKMEIRQRAISGPPLKTDFLDYLSSTYPETARLLATPQDTQP